MILLIYLITLGSLDPSGCDEAIQLYSSQIPENTGAIYNANENDIINIFMSEEDGSFSYARLEDFTAFVGSEINSQLSTHCWKQWGEVLQTAGHSQFAIIFFVNELRVLLSIGESERVLNRYYELINSEHYIDNVYINIYYVNALNALGRNRDAVAALNTIVRFENSFMYDERYSSRVRVEIMNTIGNLYYDLEQYDEAIYYFKESIEYADNNAVNSFAIQINLASAYRKIHEYSSALNLLKGILNYAVDKQDKILELQARLNLANTYKSMGSYDVAEHYYHAVIEESSKNGIEIGRFYGYLNLVEWYNEVGRLKESSVYIDSMFALLPAISSFELEVKAFELLISYYESTGMDDLASYYEREISALRNRDRDVDATKALAELYKLSFNSSRRTIEKLSNQQMRQNPTSMWNPYYLLIVLWGIVFLFWATNRMRQSKGAKPAIQGLASRVNESEGPSNESNEMTTVVNLIRNHPDYLNTVVSARELVSSLSRYSKLIRNIMKRENFPNVNALINYVRIQHAIEIMEKSDMDVSQDQLSQQVGFSTRRSYNRAFKDVTGKTPSEYLSDMSLHSVKHA